MKIARIDYDDNEAPVSITTTMSIADAAFITLMTGRLNAVTSAAVMTDGARVADDIYGCLTSVFNRHWDDGVNDYLAGEDA